MLELWMIRHGETDWNIEARVQGWTDVPLNAAGVRQATMLSLYLEGIPFRAIVSSDLGRAKHTANILCARLPAPLSVEPLLRERCFGSGEGLPRSEMLQKFPNGAPDAETDAEIQARARSFLHRIETTFPSGRILCVSHGGMIRSILHAAGIGSPPQLQNTSVNRIVHREGTWQVISYNWAQHLHRTMDVVPGSVHEKQEAVRGSD